VEKIGHGHDEDRISGLDPAVRARGTALYQVSV